jgi:hypothetical protein
MINLRSARTISILSAILILGITKPLLANEVAIGKNLRIGDDLSSTRSKLEGFCKSLEVLDVDSPRFPLAEKKEQHLICERYEHSDVTFERVAFVIADDRFVHMEAIGVSVSSLSRILGDTDSRYLDMDIYENGTYWLDENNSRFLWLHDDAKHPNLFSWHNLILDDSNYKYSPASIQIPDLLDFESDLKSLEPLFAEQCQKTRKEHHQKVWLLNKPKEQFQINCFGYLFAGFERKFEAVFGDGDLQLVWILTAKAEESRLRKLLVDRWGAPAINTENWEVYAKGRISLRKDKPELLVLSDQMIPLYRAELTSE